MGIRNQPRMFALSDIGRVRSNNEDQFLLERISDWIVVAVADGMGGAAGGEVASWLAVNTVYRLIHQNVDRLPMTEIMEDCLVLAHERIRHRGETSFGNINMGTTLTFAAIADKHDSHAHSRKVFLGHVGDSRLYLLGKDGVRQVTRDHSMTQHLLDCGVLTPQTAQNFRYRNVIYKSLGGSREFDPDPVDMLEVPQGSILLLCTDGLSNYLDPMDMWRIVNHGRNLPRAARLMVDLALLRGGADNITVAMVSAGKPRFASARPKLPADAGRLSSARLRRRRIIARLARLPGIFRTSVHADPATAPPPAALNGELRTRQVSMEEINHEVGGSETKKRPVPAAELLVTSGILEGKAFALGFNTRIGRVKGEVILEDASVAREHAQIRFAKGRYTIRSLTPADPVVIKGEKIRKGKDLVDKDEIVVGRIRLNFRIV